MPSSRRQFARRAAAVVFPVAGAGCSGRSDADEPSTRATDDTTTPGGSPATAGRTTTPSRSSLVLHGVDRDDLPPRSRVGVVSPAVWEWLTTATETGAVDVAVEDGWEPTFPGRETPTPPPTSTPAEGAAPDVDLAVAAADVLVVDGEPYAVRTTYGAGEASYRLKTRPVEASDVEPPDGTDAVAAVSELPPEQRRVALAAVEDDGYAVGFHEERSEAFETVTGYDYLRHEGETYWTFVVHGDKFRPHTTLWATPIDTADDGDDVVFEVERVDLSERGRRVFAAAVADGRERVESVPEALAAAVETTEYLATTTGLYRARVDG